MELVRQRRAPSARWDAVQRSSRAKVTAGTRKIEKKSAGIAQRVGRDSEESMQSFGGAVRHRSRRWCNPAVRWREGERTIEKLGGGAAHRARVGRTQKIQKRGCDDGTPRCKQDGGSCKRVSGAARRRRAGDGERGRGNAENRIKYARAVQRGGAMAGR
ncbi:hypothetical protein C8J57DRAFT_131534 [Mycena rebaudengoi]|nr:hypothetical protein C8J57DRAFT_131534 [Mycena rebaudengoi]